MILYDSYYGNPAPFHLLMELIKTNTTVPVSEAHGPNAIVDPEPCSLRQIVAELYAFISPASETREWVTKTHSETWEFATQNF